MLIKVCGMTDVQNLKEVHQLGIDHLGFIFYPPSKRYVEPIGFDDWYQSIPKSVNKIGVFVNEEVKVVNEYIRRFELNYVQLHGDESGEFCERINGCKVIKAFRVDENFDFNHTKEYMNCDLLLFDAKGKEYGGNGIQYNWNILHKYQGSVPYLLSGGIGPTDVKQILDFKHEKFYGIDLNSGFETKPGLKHVHKLEKFINEISCSTK